jgi:hypothetical protein
MEIAPTNNFVNSWQENSLVTLLSFITKYGVDFPYWGKAALFLLLSFVEFPFSLYENFVYGAKIQATKLKEDPIFVIGHWRSGTTHLHNLLSEDLQWATATHMKVFYSRTFFTLEKFRDFLASTLPQERGYDRVKVGLDVPEEEEEALLSYSHRSFYHAVIFPRLADSFFRRYGLLEDLEREDFIGWQKDYMWFLQKLTLSVEGRPLLLKNPVNTCRIDALRQMFPQARFIHIYRNPYEVFESNINMIQIHTKNLRLQELMSLEQLKKDILERYILMMEAYDRQSKNVSKDKLVEVSFEQVRDRPLETLEDIYTQLNLPNFTRAVPYFERYINSQKSYQQNTYRYNEENLKRVKAAWGKWLNRWGYQSPCSVA